LEPGHQRVLERAAPYLQTRDNDVHTASSLAFARALLRAEGGRAEVVLPAVILHDVGWSALSEEEQLRAFGPGRVDLALNRRHEVEGARIAAEILGALEYPVDLSGEIVAIIEAHDSREEALSLEDELVKDADKCFRYTWSYVESNCRRFGKEPEWYVEHLAGRVEEWFFTPTGKRLAREELARTAEIARGAGAPAS
jgi:hypothetical protein